MIMALKGGVSMKGNGRKVLARLLLPLFFFTASCLLTGWIPRVEAVEEDEISNAILHVGIEQKLAGRVGRYGFKTYVLLSENPQIVGIDPREDVIKKHGKEKLINYTNSDYVRFGTMGRRGKQLGKFILADKSGDILKGTFWDSFNVTSHLKKAGAGRYYLAAMAKLDRKTYTAVGLRAFLEIFLKDGKTIRSKEVYFVAKTESMNGYLERKVRNVGVEIAVDVPRALSQGE